MRQRPYVVTFVNRQTHERRSYRVHAFNKSDAETEAYKQIRAQEGYDWRVIWWPVGAEREVW